MRPFLIALKEVRSYIKDRGDLAFSLLLPVILFALMYGAFAGQGLFHGTAFVVNEDGGAYATQFIDTLRANKSLEVTLLTANDADNRLSKSDILLAVVIPSGFSADLAAGQPARLVLKQRGNGGQEGQIVAGIVRGVAQEVARPLQVRSLVGSAVAGQGVPESLVQTTVQRYLDEGAVPAVTVREHPLGTAPEPVKEFLPGILTMFVLFSITLNARAVVEERKKGTLERLMTTRLSVTQLFTGKFLAGVLRGFVQSLILLVLSYIVFRLFTPLSFLLVLFIVLVFAAAASALGLVIAAVVRTEDAATWIAVFFTMAMTMLGGTFFNMPAGSVWDALSHMSINTYANTAINGVIIGGSSLAGVWGELVVMAGVAAVCLLLSRLLFRIMPGGR
jgi:ABC-2 type transport system permease protein